MKEETKNKTVDEALVCDELWDIDNGRTLCEECHRGTDTYGYCGNQLFLGDSGIN